MSAAEPSTKAAAAALRDLEPVPGCAKPDPILVANDVGRTFGGLVAVDVEHLQIQRGVITGLIGPNGAGKTTLFNLLTGFDKADKGEWRFLGDSLQGLPAYKVARKGMVRTFQLTKSLARLTVIENMKLGATDQRGEGFFPSLVRPLWRAQEKEIEARAEELLARFKLDHMRDEFAGSLSGGQRKLLEMARALMVRPKMVMLDEPMAGVNPALTQSLLEHVKALRDEGMTVLFVEHDMEIVARYVTRIIAFDSGEIIADGPPASVLGNARVQEFVVGHQLDANAVAGETA